MKSSSALDKYGEPWTVLRFSHLVAPGSAGGAEFLDGCERRALACVNACAGLDLPDDVPVGALADLVEAARFSLSVHRDQGLFDISEQMAVADLRAALAKLEVRR